MSARPDPRWIDYVDVDGEQLHVALSPGRGTPLVVCNGFAANFDILDDFVAALDQPVLCFDPPGIGASADVRTMRRMPALAALLAHLLARLDLPAEVDMAGIGWGGLLAQQFARDHRARVRRLVLIASSSGPLMFPGRLASLWRLARPDGLTRAAPDGRSARAVFGGRRNDECRAIAQAMAKAKVPTRRGYAGQLYALVGYSSLPWLHLLTVPTLVIAGDDDAVVPMVNARMLGLLLPQARLAVVRGGGHWLALERTGEIVRLLDEFLNARIVPAPTDFDNAL